MVTKKCSHCKQNKPVSDFSRDARRKDGLNIWCTACRKAHRIETRMTNKRGGQAVISTETRTEKLCPHCRQVRSIDQFRLTAWGKAASWCVICDRERGKVHRAKPEIKERERRRHIQDTYGLSPDEYQRLIVEQGGRCSICGDTMRKIHVDHDHDTGRVRGLLCPSCNTGLGHFNDSLEMLSKAFNYLKGGNVVSASGETSA